jgi:hypothetical protein
MTLASLLPSVHILFSYLLFSTYMLLLRQEDMISNSSNDGVDHLFVNPLRHFSHPLSGYHSMILPWHTCALS